MVRLLAESYSLNVPDTAISDFTHTASRTSVALADAFHTFYYDCPAMQLAVRSHDRERAVIKMMHLKERYTSLSCNSFCNESLANSGITLQQYSLGRPSQACELSPLGISQVRDHLQCTKACVRCQTS